MLRRSKLGLVLGGGAGRGVAHLGVIKCLEEENIRPNIIFGTSIGALIGGVYATGLNIQELLNKAKECVNSEEFKSLGFEFFKEHPEGLSFKRLASYLRERLALARMAIQPYILKREPLERVIAKILPDIKIEDLKIKFGCTTLDVVSGRVIYIHKGPLREAVLKSILISGVFPPWEERNEILVDAGPTAKVPVDGCRALGADRVIAVNLGSKLTKYDKVGSALSLIFRVDEIAKFHYNKIQAEKADVLIEPKVESIHWADFTKIDFGIRVGYLATKEKLPEIRRLVKPSFYSFLRRSFQVAR
ncbi:MAG: patatin-like phospholipase family protein [candidate division WOR-3 bacterium]